MRIRRASLAAAVVVWVLAAAPAAWAADLVVLPFKGPPGAPVHLFATGCPAGTVTVAFAFRPASQTGPVFDPAQVLFRVPAPEGDATVELERSPIPLDAAPGQYAYDAFCLDQSGQVLDGPATTPFEVAVLPLTVTPNAGPVGTRVTVTGGGCPVGTTDSAFVRIHGASDQIPPFDPADPGQFGAPIMPDGSLRVSFTVPRGLPDGENAIEAFCVSEGGSALAGPGFAVFVVSGGLAPTGFGLGTGLLPVGAAAVLAGLGLVVLARRFELLRSD